MGKVKKRKAILITLFLLVLIKAAFSGEWGDVNNDSNINIVDALLVAQYYVGLGFTGIFAGQSRCKCRRVC